MTCWKLSRLVFLKKKISNHIARIWAIGHGGANKKKKVCHTKDKAKVGPLNQGLKRKADSEIALNTDPKEAILFLMPREGPPKYIEHVNKNNDRGVGTSHIFMI